MQKINTKMHYHPPLTRIFLLHLFIGSTSGYGSGNIPSGACTSMMPSHASNSAQSSAAPYEVVVSASEYAGSDTLTVTVQSTTAADFKGFFVQARSSSDDTTRIGTFSATSESQTRCSNEATSHINDDDKSSVALTWTAPSSTEGDIRFRAAVVQGYSTFWTEIYSSVITAAQSETETPTETPTQSPTVTPSSDPDETLNTTSEHHTNPDSNTSTHLTTNHSTNTQTVMEATTMDVVTYSYSTSDNISNEQDSVTTTNLDISAISSNTMSVESFSTQTEQEGQTSENQNTENDFDIDLDDCGDTRGCFRHPTGCDASDCDVAVAWQPRQNNDDYIEFEMIADSNGWVALGFSEDSSMGDDYVLMCLNDGGTVSVLSTFNQGYSNGEFDDSDYGISHVTTYYSDGTIKCKFRRQIDDSTVARRRRRRSDSSNFFNIDNRYTLFLGTGPESGSSAAQHQDTPYISDDQIRVTTSTADVEAKDIDYSAYKIHGVLMILVWLLGMAWSLIYTRFFKTTFGNKKICNNDLWFILHRAINIGCLVFFIVSFIIIFVKVDGYTEIGEGDEEYLKAHAPLGIVVAILFFSNPIVALFRPKPDAENRKIWNWFHWVIGYGAQVLAIITIFIGFNMPKAANFIDDADHGWVRTLAIVMVCLYVFTWVVLEKQRCISGNNKTENYNKDVELKPSSNEDTEKDESANKKLNILSYIILFGYLLISLGLFLAITIGIYTAEKD